MCIIKRTGSQNIMLCGTCPKLRNEVKWEFWFCNLLALPWPDKCTIDERHFSLYNSVCQYCERFWGKHFSDFWRAFVTSQDYWSSLPKGKLKPVEREANSGNFPPSLSAKIDCNSHATYVTRFIFTDMPELELDLSFSCQFPCSDEPWTSPSFWENRWTTTPTTLIYWGYFPCP